MKAGFQGFTDMFDGGGAGQSGNRFQGGSLWSSILNMAGGGNLMDWLRYNNQGAIRSQPIAPKLAEALSFLPELGVSMRVYSGGQAAKGSGGPRTGSTRHDHGNAADADFYMGDRKLDWNNPDDVPIFKEIVARGKANGVTGWGAGDDYMGAGRMHVGYGNPGVWGAGGKGANAPDWLSEAFHGQPGHIHKPNQAIADDTMAALGKSPKRQPPTSRNDTPSLLGSIGNDSFRQRLIGDRYDSRVPTRKSQRLDGNDFSQHECGPSGPYCAGAVRNVDVSKPRRYGSRERTHGGSP